VVMVVSNSSQCTLGETLCARSKEITRVLKAGNHDSANATPRVDWRLCSRRLDHVQISLFSLDKDALLQPTNIQLATLTKQSPVQLHNQKLTGATVHDSDFARSGYNLS
jgi:hypothetical protein